MRIAMFYHSLISDWNHGNAHFLRGVVRELIKRGHSVRVYEPEESWSYRNLIHDYGPSAVEGFYNAYPGLDSARYRLEQLDLDKALKNVDLVMVHEWNDPELVYRLGRHRQETGRYALFFHDTHHRAATAPDQMSKYDLSHFDGVLCFGEVLRRIYLDRGWARKAWVWHEAADIGRFHPFLPGNHRKKKDLVWIGNWGDEERTSELRDFVIEPVQKLGFEAEFYGVRYPEAACAELQKANIAYRGWLANYRVAETFANFRFTVHVPRRPYAQALPGIPTIRVFEALACGIPLLSSPWQDSENLFTPGDDYLVARDGAEMLELMRMLVKEPMLAHKLSDNGLRKILERHTCGHRVEQLVEIVSSLGVSTGKPTVAPVHAHEVRPRVPLDGSVARVAATRLDRAARDRR